MYCPFWSYSSPEPGMRVHLHGNALRRQGIRRLKAQECGVESGQLVVGLQGKAVVAGEVVMDLRQSRVRFIRLQQDILGVVELPMIHQVPPSSAYTAGSTRISGREAKYTLSLSISCGLSVRMNQRSMRNRSSSRVP